MELSSSFDKRNGSKKRNGKGVCHDHTPNPYNVVGEGGSSEKDDLRLSEQDEIPK